MLISLHRQATTTPKIRAAIQARAEPARLMAERCGISAQTVWIEPRPRHRFERRGEGASATACRTAANARRFRRDLERAAPMKITEVLIDNGKEFTDRLFCLRRHAANGSYDFDQLGIEHRLTPPMHPQTNGLVERFNGRTRDVLQSHHVHSGADLEQTILR